MLEFNSKQLEKVSNLFMDISKWFIVGAFAINFIANDDIIKFFKLLFYGIIFTYLSLKMMQVRK